MEHESGAQIEFVIECIDVNAMVAFLVDDVGGRIELITPADDPAEYVVAVHGARLRLVRGSADRPVRLRLYASDGGHLGDGAVTGSGSELVAPNGSVFEFIGSTGAVTVPPTVASLSVVCVDDGDEFGAGRAGMGYRDLLPDRWGGSFIASHICIAEGGDVADYVHFHRIRFQMIFVAAGWVDVVYEDQGEPFRMHAGDCVLQPPEIRHRVLRSSPGLEVIEIGSPAVHDTLVEHEIDLPTATLSQDRDFSGQRFVRHIAAEFPADVSAPDPHGFVHRDTGIAAATNGLADARVLTVAAADVTADVAALDGAGRLADMSGSELTHEGEFAMCVVLAGSAVLAVDADGDRRTVEVGSRDAVALPAGSRWYWANRTADFELLQVVLPAGCIHSAGAARGG